MAEATLKLHKSQRPSGGTVELYYGEFDSTYFHGLDDSAMTKILWETEPKAPFPETRQLYAVKQAAGTTFAAVASAFDAVTSSIISAVQSAASSASQSDSSHSGGARPSDYYSH